MTAADRKPVSFGTPAGSTVSAFEKMLGGEEPLDFAPPKTGGYKQPNPPNLPLVKEPMELTICVSPEAGWSELEAFLGETKSSADGCDVSVHGAAYFRGRRKGGHAGGRKFELILHPVPEKPAEDRRQGQRPRRGRGGDRSARKKHEETVRADLGDAVLEGQSGRPVCLGLSHQGRGARRQRLLAFERQLAIVEPAERASVRRRCRKAAGRLPAQIQSRLSRHHQERQARRRSTSSTSSAISSCARRRPASTGELRSRARPVRARRRSRGGRSRSQRRRSCSSRCGSTAKSAFSRCSRRTIMRRTR